MSETYRKTAPRGRGERADTPDLEARAVRLGGSSPSARTNQKRGLSPLLLSSYFNPPYLLSFKFGKAQGEYSVFHACFNAARVYFFRKDNLP